MSEQKGPCQECPATTFELGAPSIHTPQNMHITPCLHKDPKQRDLWNSQSGAYSLRAYSLAAYSLGAYSLRAYSAGA